MDKIQRCPFVPNWYDIPNTDFGSAILDGLSKQPAAIAMTNLSTGESITNGEFIERSEAVAKRLWSNGCRKGDVVAMFSPNSIDWMLVATATYRIGGAVAGINSLLTAEEVSSQLRLCQPKFLFTTKTLATVALEANKSGVLVQKILLNVAYPGCTQLSTQRQESGEQLPTLPSITELCIKSLDVALIMFSSGTTGSQKAVLQPQRSLMANVALFKHPLLWLKADHIIAIGPFCHLSGFFWTTIHLVHGVHVLFDERFNFSRYLKTIADYKITNIGVVLPTVATMLAKSPEVDKYNLQLKHIRCGSAPLSKEVEELLMNRFPGVQVRQGYGMTEMLAMALFLPYELDGSAPRKWRPGSVGVPTPRMEIKVVDPETGALQGPNSPGELVIHSPTLMLGYAQNPAATAATIDKDGWLHTGDVGYYDDDGYFYIVDRLKELIKYNSYQVAPAELEAVLLSHPEVADSGVIGIPDPSAGELPMAWVVKKDGATVSEKDIQNYVATKVAPYKALRGGVRFVPSIPKTASGKILRKEMRKAVTQGHL